MAHRPLPRRFVLVEAVLDAIRAQLPDFELPYECRRYDFEAYEASRNRPFRQQHPSPSFPPDPVLARSYAALGLPYGSRLPLVRRAWRRLVKSNHPDHFADDPVVADVKTELVKTLNGACEELERRLGGLED